MSLYTRLIGIDSPRIPVHLFHALAHEFKRGHVTGNQARTALGLSAAEAQEANTLMGLVQNDTLTAEEVHQVLLIASAGVGIYHTEASLKSRFGV